MSKGLNGESQISELLHNILRQFIASTQDVAVGTFPCFPQNGPKTALAGINPRKKRGRFRRRIAAAFSRAGSWASMLDKPRVPGETNGALANAAETEEAGAHD